jgi:hypothetical protein
MITRWKIMVFLTLYNIGKFLNLKKLFPLLYGRFKYCKSFLDMIRVVLEPSKM